MVKEIGVLQLRSDPPLGEGSIEEKEEGIVDIKAATTKKNKMLYFYRNNTR